MNWYICLERNVITTLSYTVMRKTGIDLKHILLKNIHKIVVLFILTIANFYGIYAGEVRISVAGANARQGDHLTIAVSGSVSADTLSSIRIVFDYNANRLRIDSVGGNVNYVIKCAQPTVFDSVFAELGTLKVSCTDAQNIADGNICTLYITCLAGEGNEALITPSEVVINDSNLIGNFESGKITFNDTPVKQKFIEGLGYPSPNPFWGTIRIPYTIDQPTNVSFYIYDLVGRLVREFPTEPRTRGSYFFNFTPNEGEFSNGAYYLFMKTDATLYSSYFLKIR